MTNTEQKILQLILEKKSARVGHIAKTAGFTSDYVNLVCQGLHRRGYVNFRRGVVAVPAMAEEAVPSDAPAEESITLPEMDEPAGEEGSESASPEAQASIADLTGLNIAQLTTLGEAGYNSISDLANAPISKLMQAGSMNVKQAANLINQARAHLRMINTEI